MNICKLTPLDFGSSSAELVAAAVTAAAACLDLGLYGTAGVFFFFAAGLAFFLFFSQTYKQW